MLFLTCSFHLSRTTGHIKMNNVGNGAEICGTGMDIKGQRKDAKKNWEAEELRLSNYVDRFIKEDPNALPL